jgi:predicted metalloprotease
MNRVNLRRSLPFAVVRALGLTLTVAVIALAVVASVPRATLSTEPADLDAVAKASEISLQQFWTRQMLATYHKPFAEVRGGYQPKVPNSPPWTCNGQKMTYRDIRGNAFYCGGDHDDYIAYDAAFLLPTLDKRFGSVAPAIVLAHETGHAVQRRAGVQVRSILLEQQADCFAGAWLAQVPQPPAVPVAKEPSALDSAVAVMLTLRDQPGTPAVNPKAHGLGFDRVNAFQSGYDGGSKSCADMPRRGVVVTELPFQTPVEALNAGDMPYDVALPVFFSSLDDFWTRSLPTLRPGRAFIAPNPLPTPAPPLPDCPQVKDWNPLAAIGYCPSGNTVTWADAVLRQLHQEGDMFTGTLVGLAWARAAQVQAGLPIYGRAARLQRVCFTGSWIGSIGSGAEAPAELSPGDLDEALAAVLATSFGPGGNPSDQGGAFARTDALRRGVLHGLPACR